MHAQGPASGLWVTLYPSRPTGRLDHPRTAGGAQAGGSATRSTPSSGPGTGPGGPEDRATDSDLEHDGQSTTKSVGHRRNSRALSAPFCSRTRKLPHKNCRTLPAIPADQVSIFCVSRVDSSATRAWRSRFSVTSTYHSRPYGLNLPYHTTSCPVLLELWTAPLPCPGIFLLGLLSAARGPDLLPQTCPCGLVWRFGQRVCLADFRLVYLGLFLAEQPAVRSRPRRQGDLLPRTCLRRTTRRIGHR